MDYTTMNQIMSRRMFGILAIYVLFLRIDSITAFNVTETSSSSNTQLGSKSPKALRGARALSENTITTPNCNMLRTAEYPAELQLFYTYSVEINDDLLLYDMERAIDNAVVIELDMCDVTGRPVYKVRTSTTHSFSTSGTCDPIFPENTCMVVNGETAVLLDESSDSNFVRTKVFIGISHGLGDVAFLNGFSNSVVSAALISEGHATLVENRERIVHSEASHRSGITTTVAVAAASVTIVVASILCYGFMRRSNSRDPMIRHRNRSLRKPDPRTIVVGSQLGVPMRRHFVRLEDLSSSPTSFLTSSISPRNFSNVYSEENDQKFPLEFSESEYYTEVNYNPAVNWSVSDITSDSASLRSGVSRTPSMLERIEEEDEDVAKDEDEEDEDEDDKSCNFSYSEDSTIITKELSKAGIVSEDDCEEEDNNATPPEKKISNFDGAIDRQDHAVNVSDLDPCFTILPENIEEVFRDLEDLSSEGTQDSPIESIVLELRLSIDDGDSFKTALSDNTMISLPQPWNFESESTLENVYHRIPIENNQSDRSESSTLKSLISIGTEDNSALDNVNPSTPLQVNEKSDSFYSPLNESPASSFDAKETADSPSRKDVIIHTVSDSDDESLASGVDSDVEYNEGFLDEVSATSFQSKDCKAKPSPMSIELNDFRNTAKEVVKDALRIETIDSIKVCSKMDTVRSEVDDDSIDEWVNELMKEEPNENGESNVTDTY